VNFKAFGWLIFTVGLLGGLATWIKYSSLDRDQTRAAVQSLLGLGTTAGLEARLAGADAKGQQQRLQPWMIASGVAAVLGLCMAFAASGEPRQVRTCPKCAESIQLHAVLCKHCGTDLTAIGTEGTDWMAQADERANDRPQSYRELAAAAEKAEAAAKGR
jgi:hypothetical protein